MTATLTAPAPAFTPAPTSVEQQPDGDAPATFHALFEITGALTTTEPLSYEAFCTLAGHFPDLRMEREPNGQITIMPPNYSGSSFREGEAFGLVWQWNRQTKLGRAFSPSVGIDLPDGATRQADTVWVSNERLAAFNATKLDSSFLPLAPDFVIEIRSETDRLKVVKEKMTDAWIANGVRLAWLIDPYEEKAWIYRANGSIDVVEGFEGKKLSGEEVLPGFELELAEFRLPT